MSRVASFLYLLVIEPIEYIIETSFCLFQNFFPGQAKIPLSIVALSLLVNLLTFPIYSAADARQQEEREMQMKLSKWKARIKSTFKGDERFMMLSAYYRLNGYNPIYALRGSLSILVQVPFFIAAYHFLSECPELSGVKLGPIEDLLKPDGLLWLPSCRVNLLPILMTAVNLVSGMIYIRGGVQLREKIQVYGLALIFLVLLYGSPSGLVFYWIFNQFFSLAKNLIRKNSRPDHLIKILLCVSLAVFCLYVDFFRTHSHVYKKVFFSLFCAAVCFLCLVKKGGIRNFFVNAAVECKHYTWLFAASCTGLFLLVGSFVPLSVLSSDPVAFSFLEGYSSPFLLYRYNLVKVAGLFLLWPAFIYGLSADRWKPLLSAIFSFVFFSAILNFYLFSSDYGFLSDILVYENDEVFHAESWYKALNVIVLMLLILLVCFLLRRKLIKPMFLLTVAMCVAVMGHSLMEASKVRHGYERFFTRMRGNPDDTLTDDLKPIFKISKTGRNVFCIMLDRATGAYLNECFAEDPNLYEQYEGFTFYPNAVSFSYCTLAGAPGLFGGYEYVPAVMNMKSDDSMAEKLEEATLMLPRIFARNGYSSVMTDMPLQSFLNKDFELDKYSETIRSYVTEGTYWFRWKKEHGFGASIQLETDKKRFLPYAVLRVAPVFLRSKLYEEGSYLISNYVFDEEEVMALPGGGSALDVVIKNYAALDYLPALTQFSDEGDTFTFMANDLTHCPHVLQLPDYVPSKNVTQLSPSKYAVDEHYYVNMAALKLLGKWLDYLKENDAYDNTRIIIASDHGCGEGTKNVESYSHLPRGELTCLLLVKDFRSRGRLNVDKTFMTNADVPSMSVSDLIESPINPATGNDITKISLKNPVYGEYTDWQKAFKDIHSNALDVDEDTWYSIHDDIFDAKNWGKPSSAKVYEDTLVDLRGQGVYIGGGSR